MFTDDDVLLGQSEEQLQRLVGVFDSVCKRRNPTVNVGKNKVMMPKGNAITRCRITMNEQVMDNVGHFFVTRKHSVNTIA